MTFLELARTRRSCRHYLPDPVPEDLRQQVLDAGRWAPSALNSQPWEFIIITDPAVKQHLYDTASIAGFKWKHLLTAPMIVVVVARRLSPYSRDDCIFAAQNMLLEATELGLGSCWLGGFSEARVKRLLSVPDSYLLPGMMTLGYPERVGPPPPRADLERQIHRQTYQSRGLDLTHVSRIGRLAIKLLRLGHEKGEGKTDE
ncbi:MAG: nitroreductase family protein [Armatimonadia bacterium]